MGDRVLPEAVGTFETSRHHCPTPEAFVSDGVQHPYRLGDHWVCPCGQTWRVYDYCYQGDTALALWKKCRNRPWRKKLKTETCTYDAAVLRQRVAELEAELAWMRSS